MNYILSYLYILLFSTFSLSISLESLSFEAEPSLVDQSNSALSLRWTTNQLSKGYYRMSTYPTPIKNADAMIGFTESQQTDFLLNIDKLQDSEFYYFQAINIVDGDTLYSDIELYSLVSKSSGEIEVYFNNSIDISKSRGSQPNGQTAAALEQSILDKINGATMSIDYCIYNTHRESIVDALVDAANRGVQVRVIHNEKSESSNIGFNRSLPFNIVERLGDGLMHNKFLIIDADDVDQSWIMSGSTNFTDFQMDVDPNHTIYIQDQNLAKAYEIEFEEMWGSDSATPDGDKARFGKNKTDNTPHEFMINGKRVELYFSPSDLVSGKINNTLQDAESAIDAALLIFTKWETRDALEDELATGTKFRAIVEDQENSGDIISRLNAKGARIIAHPEQPQMHHKYAIIDEALQDQRSKVITGSHNWTHSADIRHDENLLIIHDPEIANWFQQEWEARWAEQTTAVIDLAHTTPLLLYPNPAKDLLTLTTSKEISEYKILDIRGAHVATIVNNSKGEQLLDISGLEQGSYVLVGIDSEGKRAIGTFIKN